MADYGSTFLIQELTSTNEVRRTLALTGAGLPKQAAPWSTKNRSVRTNYPGQKRATVQLLGTAEMPSDFEGMWRATMLSRSPAVLTDENGVTVKTSTPKSIVDFAESLFTEGRLLRVSWIQSSGSDESSIQIVREGTADEWTFTWIRAQDLDWRIKFGWNGRNESRSKPIVSRGGDIYSLNAKTRSAIEKFKKRAKPVTDKGTATVNSIAALSQLANLPTKFVKSAVQSADRLLNQIDSIGDIVQTFAQQPSNIIDTVVNFSSNAVATANQFVDKMNRIPIEVRGSKAKVADLIRMSNQMGGYVDAQEEMARAAFDAAIELRRMHATLRPIAKASSAASANTKDIITVHVVRDGETLMSISSRYYGTPDQVNAILKANRITAYVVKVKSGTPLVIPVLDTATDSAATV